MAKLAIREQRNRRAIWIPACWFLLTWALLPGSPAHSQVDAALPDTAVITIKPDSLNANEFITTIKMLIRKYNDLDSASSISAQDHFGITFALTEDEVSTLADANPNIAIEYPLTDQDYLYKSQFTRAMDDQYMSSEVQNMVLEKAKKVHERYNEQSQLKYIVKWQAAEDCGCALDLGDQIVYGFYPYWLGTTAPPSQPSEEGTTEDEAPPAQELDFRTVTRIGYYGVRLTDTHTPPEENHWRLYPRPDFINTARQHNVKVDVVVFNNHWDQWTKSATKTDTMVARVAGLLKGDIDPNPIRNTINHIAYGADYGWQWAYPTRGDGITLHFDFSAYPNDVENLRKHLRSFIEQLRLKVKYGDEIEEEDDRIEKEHKSKEGHPNSSGSRKLNIMLPMHSLGKGVYSWELIDAIRPDIDLFLVALETPTTATKKILRTMVEMGVSSGDARREILRKIIPVVSSDAHYIHKENENNQNLFDEDLVYFENNFKGIGLWPLPLSSNPNRGKDTVIKVQNSVKKAYIPPSNPITDQLDYIYNMYYCPNRWLFLICLPLWAFLGLVYFLLSSHWNQLLARIENKVQYALIAAGFLNLTAFLLWDPISRSWEEWGWIFAVILFGLTFFIRRLLQSNRELP